MDYTPHTVRIPYISPSECSYNQNYMQVRDAGIIQITWILQKILHNAM